MSTYLILSQRLLWVQTHLIVASVVSRSSMLGTYLEIHLQRGSLRKVDPKRAKAKCELEDGENLGHIQACLRDLL